MNLQTKISLGKQSEDQIDYNSNVLLFGSCFSENIGKKLDYFKFKNSQNPFGILFHPKAIETLISNAVDSKHFSEEDVFFHNEQWACFDAHSKLSHTSKDTLINQLNEQIDLTNSKLKSASHIIITLGTAWVYREISTNNIVANCHKVPQKQFKRELLSVEEITASLKQILSLIRSVNYTASVIFTVSPIRHTKDGFVANTQSKAHLITAIHQVISNQSFYFPSFEIMMDELRDYRFYQEDMVHPSQLAINYIWDKFKMVWISDQSFKTMEEVEVVQKGLQHKPFNIKSEAHQKFLQNLEVKISRLQIQFPYIVF
ncbi:GSCFA domain-containing protein [Algibacter sp. R77976]|uniref:GSCFA domain-containing protein n=1 Tax=Algibacter sp. R77976 TaxID=3093873 RepID=UPI0037CCBACA